MLKTPCTAHSVGLANSIIAGFVHTLLTSYCQVANGPNWPKDYGPKFMKCGPEVFDFVVIGAGTAGPVIAGRLSENPNVKVLLIEAGDDPPLESEVPGYTATLSGTKYDYDYVTTSNNKSCLMQFGQSCRWTRGKMIGGCSALNFLLYTRGNRRDYDTWEKQGNPTWGWDTVFKYFKKTEDYLQPNPYNIHGTGGPLKVSRFVPYQNEKKLILQAAVERGYDYIDDFRDGHNLGYGIINSLAIDGIRNTPAKAFLLNKPSNLKLIKNAIVTKINFDKNKRARSVSFVYKDKYQKSHKLEVKASKEIILSAGTVDTPKILMHSGVGPKKHLKSLGIPVISDLPVGKNLQDHVCALIFFKINKNHEEDAVQSFYNYFIHRKGDLTGVTCIDATGFVDARNESGIFPSVEIHHIWFPVGKLIPDFILGSDIKEALAEPIKKTAILVMGIILLNPKSKGYIKLGSRDYRQQPIIYPNYLNHPDDIDVILRTMHELRKFEHTPTFRKHGAQLFDIPLPHCAAFKYGSNEYWECYVRHRNFHIYHPVGTSKMGPHSDPSTVVDWRLRVKGVSGLRVVDASIMPNIPSANTMSPTVMIAERAADFIKEDCGI